MTTETTMNTIDYGMQNYAAEDLDDADDYPDPSDDEFDEYEDERRAARGTSECDNTCDPQCSWCLVAHACPDECDGDECPYELLDPSIKAKRSSNLGMLDAMEKTKRKHLVQFMDRRAYWNGYESWIRRNSKRARKQAARESKALESLLIF